MAYGQTTKGALQIWADLVSDQAYIYENMVPNYQKSIHFTPPDLRSRYANLTPCRKCDCDLKSRAAVCYLPFLC